MRYARRAVPVLWVVCLAMAIPALSDRAEVTLCHVPPGNPENAQTLRVAASAVPAHLAHGDLEGACTSGCEGYPSPVARTGQTISYAPGDDGEYQAGVSVDPRFTDNADGTVTDNLTGLTWLKLANCFQFRDWYEALSDANALADGSCGLTDGSLPGDWRLPNVKELLSLVDYGRENPAFPAVHPFLEVHGTNYWTSTTLASIPSGVWGVYFRDGGVYSYTKTGAGYVWPVRG